MNLVLLSVVEQTVVTNLLAICYMVVAMRALGYSKREMERIQEEMNWQFDTVTKEEAAKLASRILCS
jgi:hypothetical protein